MEETYMIKIWHVIGAIENQNLTVKEQQERIINILSLMKQDVKDFTKSELKKQYSKAVEDALKIL